MGIRGEIFSTKAALQNRTYFFNVKENRMGDLYLNIVESKNKDTGGFDRQSIVLFADDLQEFLSGFDESLKVMEKAVREQRKTAADKRPPAARSENPKPRDNGSKGRAGSRPKGEAKNPKGVFAQGVHDQGRPPGKGRRLVVKKGK